MKKTISTIAILLLLATMVSAYDIGQYVHKEAYVTGTWGWVNDSWEQGNFLTAAYIMDTQSPEATVGYYVEVETLGDYQYDLESHFGSNADTTLSNELHAWTVNPPEETPGTAHTHLMYSESNYAAQSNSHTEIEAYGGFDYSSTTYAEGSATQDVEIDIN